MFKNVHFFISSIDIYLERYIQELYNMTEIAVISNITSYQLQLKEKHQIFAKQWLIHPKCVTAFEIDAGGT